MTLLPLCTSSGSLASGGGILACLFLGLAGSALHCGPMCGPLVMGQTAGRMACLACPAMTEAARLRAGLLPRYHAGRITTYALLGALCGYAGGISASVAAPLRITALITAGCLLLAIAAGLLSTRANTPPPRILTQALRRLHPGSFLFGTLLGLLPCNLVYGALFAAMASGNPWRGAAFMLAFGLGTVPILAAIGIAGHTSRLRAPLRRAMPALLGLNAAFLFAAAFRAAHLI
jgi:hypothetical protein